VLRRWYDVNDTITATIVGVAEMLDEGASWRRPDTTAGPGRDRTRADTACAVADGCPPEPTGTSVTPILTRRTRQAGYQPS
jgi:hypothetical protein